MAKPEEKEDLEKNKNRKSKARKALIGRVKKVVKKSRRKLSEEKFKKELQRTIAFLEQLQTTLGNPHAGTASAARLPAKKPSAKRPATKKPAVKSKIP